MGHNHVWSFSYHPLHKCLDPLRNLSSLHWRNQIWSILGTFCTLDIWQHSLLLHRTVHDEQRNKEERSRKNTTFETAVMKKLDSIVRIPLLEFLSLEFLIVRTSYHNGCRSLEVFHRILDYRINRISTQVIRTDLGSTILQRNAI